MRFLETIVAPDSSGERPPSTATSRTGTRLHDDFPSAVDSPDVIRTDSCEPGERIGVKTRNSWYELIVLAGGSGQVLVRGGCFLSEFRRARLTGSTAGGSALKPKIVQVGLRMELVFDDQIVSTSTVLALSRISPDPELV
jgi:hypothetical protein